MNVCNGAVERFGLGERFHTCVMVAFARSFPRFSKTMGNAPTAALFDAACSESPCSRYADTIRQGLIIDACVRQA